MKFPIFGLKESKALSIS